MKPTHLDEEGRVRMVDVGEKPVTARTAVAEGSIRMQAATLQALREGRVAKGEVLAVVRLAAIGGAKNTSALIPLCHPVPLDAVTVEIELDDDPPGCAVRVTASARWRTGVEMEALCGVSAGLLACYDMCKAMDRGMTVGPIRLKGKHGGRSGSWVRPAELA